MKTHKIISVLAMAAGLSLPMISFAGPDLTIVNNTNRDSTTVLNGGPCSSTVLGASGVTKAHSTNVVSGVKLSLACISNKENCKADVYMTNNCTGSKIAEVLFSTSTGIKTYTILDSIYSMNGGGFKAEINGGPSFN